LKTAKHIYEKFPTFVALTPTKCLRTVFADYSNSREQPRILMTAGEVSGDKQAAHLAKAMLRQDPHIRIYGSGGERMREVGVDVRIQTSHYGSVGFQESLRFVRPLRRVMAELRHLIRTDPPDLAILVDNEGFNGLLAKFLFREGIPFVYYLPPQVWFWGEWRAKAIAERAAAIIPAFHAEAEIYAREGGRVEWFGHPLIDIVKPDAAPSVVFGELGLDPAAQTIAIMPGSRFQELEQLAGNMLQAVRIIMERHPRLQVILPLAAPHLLLPLRAEIQRAGMNRVVTIVEKHVYSALSHCALLMLASGTATLEGALLGVPMVAAYRVSSVTYLIGRQLVKSRFITMPNILLDEQVVPELIQHEVTPERLASEALMILEDEERAHRMRSKLGLVRSMLGAPGVLSRAADFLLCEVELVSRVPHAEAL
jgi:lipid-A-disaccharide synthase